MTPRDIKRIDDFYTSALAKFGPSDARSVHWVDTIGQYARFRVLAGIIEKSADLPKNDGSDMIENAEIPAEKLVPRVLDVGCGTGEMYKFFLTEKIPVHYLGIDIVPELVATAQKRFPDGHFVVQDIFDFNNDRPTDPDVPDKKSLTVMPAFDYVLASGALSFKVADNLNYYQSMIRKMFALAKRGLAFNMLNAAGHVDDETYAAYDPKQIAEFCQTLGGHVEIILDYLPQDFTVYMRK
jgi:SAM-dependent methyltransferase